MSRQLIMLEYWVKGTKRACGYVVYAFPGYRSIDICLAILYAPDHLWEGTMNDVTGSKWLVTARCQYSMVAEAVFEPFVGW